MTREYKDVEIAIFPSPERYRAYDAKEEPAIAALIRSHVLPREKATYRSVKVRVHRRRDGTPAYLVAYMLRRDTYTADVVRVDVDKAYGVTGFEDDYVDREEEAQQAGTEEEPPGEPRALAESTGVEFVAATPVPEIASAKAAVEKVYDLACSAGLNAVKLLGADATVANYKSHLSAGLRGFVNVGHGNPNGIVLHDGNLSASWFSSLGRRLCPAVIYFNSCQVFNAPLQPAIMAAGARTFVGGIVNLGIGTSEEVCKCFWDNVLAKGAAMSVLTTCEQTKYPTVGAHGIAGDLGTFNFLTATLDSYKVVLYGKNQTPESLVAFVHCYHGSDNVVSCEFYADGSTIPDNRYGGCRVGLAYPWSRYAAIIDVLRNEKPLYYGYIFSTKVGYIASNMEPVGEAEA